MPGIRSATMFSCATRHRVPVAAALGDIGKRPRFWQLRHSGDQLIGDVVRVAPATGYRMLKRQSWAGCRGVNLRGYVFS